MTTLRSGSATDVGRVRSSNQDVSLEDPDLFAVADGMGGHVGGEVAARVAVDSLRAAFQRQPTVEGLRQAVAEANRAVWRQGQTESGLRGMGTTLTATALVAEPDGRQVIALANVGDSRAYVFSEYFKGQLIQVTADHSLAEEKVRQGQLTEAEAAVHPHRHILTRALGVSSDVDVDLWELHLHDGDRILLCSDGLTNEIGDERIGRVLGSVKDPTEAAGALVKAALDHGGSDNVTCVVIDVAGASAPAAPSTAPGEDEQAGAAGTAGAATTVAGVTAGPDGASHDGVPGDGSGASGRGSTPEGNGRDEGSADEAGGGETRVLRAVSGPGTSARARTGTRATGSGTSRTTAVVAARPRPAAGEKAGGGPAATESDEGDPPNGAGGRLPGTALSSARLQAAELRRLRPTRVDRRYRRRSAGVPRLITVRLVLFVLLLLAVVAAAYAAMRWYAMDDWYVGIDHGHLAVYQGRPGGFLWFKPQLVDETPVTTSEVLSYTIPHDRQEPSLAAAKKYVRNLHAEYLSTKSPSNGGTAPSSHTPGSSTSPATSTSTTGAFAPPVAAWQ